MALVNWFKVPVGFLNKIIFKTGENVLQHKAAEKAIWNDQSVICSVIPNQCFKLSPINLDFRPAILLEVPIK